MRMRIRQVGTWSTGVVLSALVGAGIGMYQAKAETAMVECRSCYPLPGGQIECIVIPCPDIPGRDCDYYTMTLEDGTIIKRPVCR